MGHLEYEGMVKYNLPSSITSKSGSLSLWNLGPHLRVLWVLTGLDLVWQFPIV